MTQRISRAAVMVAPDKPIEVRDFPLPELEPGGVLVETTYSEVCGTDVHLHHGRLGGVPYPIIPGHVSVGVIHAVHGDVRDLDGRPIREGDPVTFLDVHETCGRCWHCLVAKASTRCPSRRVYGVTYSATEGLLGGWSQFIYLKPGVKILRLPEGLSPERVIAGGCALPTAIHAIDRAEIKLGDSVVVQGAGPVGLSVAALARIVGAGAVYVVDRFENRLEVARAFGADQTIRVEKDGSHLERIRELTSGRGADITIEATGAAAAVVEGVRMTRDAGRYVIVGQYTDAGEISLNPHLDINKKHLEIRGVWGVDFGHFYRMLQVLRRHGSSVGGGWERVVSRRYTLEQAGEALSAVERGEVVKALIVPSPVA